MVSRSAAEQNENGSAAGRLSGDDTPLQVSNQDRIGQADRMFLSSLIQQFRFWLAAAAMIVIIAGTDQNDLNVRSRRAEQVAYPLVDLAQHVMRNQSCCQVPLIRHDDGRVSLPSKPFDPLTGPLHQMKMFRRGDLSCPSPRKLVDHPIAIQKKSPPPEMLTHESHYSVGMVLSGLR